jgi:molybdopterin synthase catalytic subunit
VCRLREASVVIAVSSAHRATAIRACERLIDTLKQQVPIFKKEFYTDDPAEWKQNNECAWAGGMKSTNAHLK